MNTQFLRFKGLNQKNTRSKNRELVMSRVMQHNLREISTDIGLSLPNHINPTLSKNNILLQGGNTSSIVIENIKQVMQNIKVSKWRVDTILAIELLFCLPANSEIDIIQYFVEATQWAENFFEVPLVSSVIHLDEDAPHCHAILIPIRNSKLCGSDVMGNKTKVKSMHKDFYENVGKLFNLTKPFSKKRVSAAQRNAAINLIFNALKKIYVIKNDVLRILVDAHRNDPEPLLISLGLKMPRKACKAKTFAEIIIKPQKYKKERYGYDPIFLNSQSFPIEVEKKNIFKKDQPLCSVEVDSTNQNLYLQNRQSDEYRQQNL